MKKLLLSIALLASLSASAQILLTSDLNLSRKSYDSVTNILRLSMLRSESAQHSLITDNNGAIVKVYDPLFNDVKLERVSYRNEKYGTTIQQSSEVQFRKSKLAEYKKLGYTFDGMVTGANGKFMKFVK